METTKAAARFGISCEGTFQFKSAAAAQRALNRALESARIAAKRNPAQFGPMLARLEAASVVERA